MPEPRKETANFSAITDMNPKLAEFIEAGGKICTPEPKHSLAISNFVNAQADKDHQYASYFPAMLVKFMSAATAVALDENENIVGVYKNMYRSEDKLLIPTHFNTASGYAFLQDPLLQHVEQKTIEHYGASHILEKPKLLNGSSQALKTLPFTSQKNSILLSVDDEKYIDVMYNSPYGEEIILRKPYSGDAQAMLDVVLNTNENNSHGGLDVYALESYERMCNEFAQTSMVATIGNKVVGFVTGFLMPNTPEPELFIWQVGVSVDYHGRGIGGNALIELVNRIGAKSFVTTIEGDNIASQRIFQKLADSMGITFRITDDSIDTSMLSNFDDTHPHQTEHIFKGQPLQLAA